MEFENVNGDNSKNFATIIKGTGISIILTLMLLLVFSILLTYTNISESTMVPGIIGITGVSLLLGSAVAVKHIKKNGIMNGGIIGLIYIVFIYLLSSLINLDFSLNFYSLIMIIAGIVAGMLGGVIGVNMK